MKKSLKMALLSSIIMMSVGANASKVENLHFTGNVLANVDSCVITSSKTVDLGNVGIDALTSSHSEDMVSPVSFTVNVSGCVPNEPVNVTLSGDTDSANNHVLANKAGPYDITTGKGGAEYAGVVVRDSDNNVVVPNLAFNKMTDPQGKLDQSFTASITKSSSNAPTPGQVIADATITLDTL